MQLQGLEGRRGRGALELNSQPRDQTQREIHERDGVRTQSEQRKRQRSSYGRQNRSTTVGIVVVYLTFTDPLQIEPWSKYRRNQTKPNREHKKIGEKKQGKQTEGQEQENSQQRESSPGS